MFSRKGSPQNRGRAPSASRMASRAVPAYAPHAPSSSVSRAAWLSPSRLRPSASSQSSTVRRALRPTREFASWLAAAVRSVGVAVAGIVGFPIEFHARGSLTTNQRTPQAADWWSLTRFNDNRSASVALDIFEVSAVAAPLKHRFAPKATSADRPAPFGDVDQSTVSAGYAEIASADAGEPHGFRFLRWVSGLSTHAGGCGLRDCSAGETCGLARAIDGIQDRAAGPQPVVDGQQANEGFEQVGRGKDERGERVRFGRLRDHQQAAVGRVVNHSPPVAVFD